MPRYYRAYKVVRLTVVAAAVVLITTACGSGGRDAAPGQVDAENSAAIASAGLTADADFEAQFYCKNTGTRIALDRYLIGAQRDEGLPPPSSPDYEDALPPICIVSPIGGVPPYTASAAIDGRELRRVATGTTELTFAVPPLPTGIHTVEFIVTESGGAQSAGSAEVELYWEDPSRMTLAFSTPSAQLSVREPGTAVEFEIAYESFEPTEQPQLGIESFETQSYSVTWGFGDGVTETQTADARAGVARASHVYDEEGLYETTVSIAGDSFGQHGSSSMTVDVRPAGSTRTATGDVIQQWRLVDSIVNPAGALLKTKDVDRVFSEDSLNTYVERSITLFDSSITMVKVTGKGTRQSYIGSYTLSADSAPELLTAGQTATFSVIGEVTNVLGTDAEGETLRLVGMPDNPDQTADLGGDVPLGALQATFDVPLPTQVGQVIVITASLDGCNACAIQWVYQYG